MKVKDCMCEDVCCVKPETKIYDVVKLMDDYHIGAIPVCTPDNTLCGIVTDRDILLRSIATDKDIKTTPVSDIMTCNVCWCGEEDEMTKAEETMSENQVRRLPVCDTNKKVIGILTLGDLVHNGTELGRQQVCTTIENICDCTGQTKNAE